MSNFKVGDHVVCIDADGCPELQYGWDYVVQEDTTNLWGSGIQVVGVLPTGTGPFGYPWHGFSDRRFRLRGVAASESQRVAFIKMKV